MGFIRRGRHLCGCCGWDQTSANKKNIQKWVFKSRPPSSPPSCLYPNEVSLKCFTCWMYVLLFLRWDKSEFPADFQFFLWILVCFCAVSERRHPPPEDKSSCLHQVCQLLFLEIPPRLNQSVRSAFSHPSLTSHSLYWVYWDEMSGTSRFCGSEVDLFCHVCAFCTIKLHPPPPPLPEHTRRCRSLGGFDVQVLQSSRPSQECKWGLIKSDNSDVTVGLPGGLTGQHWCKCHLWTCQQGALLLKNSVAVSEGVAPAFSGIRIFWNALKHIPKAWNT